MAYIPVVKVVTVRFQDGKTLTEALPTDTRDPRYEQCTDHQFACMCREAHLAENQREAQIEHEMTKRAFNEVLAGHNTFAPQDPFTECRCTGCEIARRLRIYRTQWDVRDEHREQPEKEVPFR
jgi:hypothetical protein